MGPNWAEQLQAWSSVATAAFAFWGLGFVAWQIRQATTTIQGNTNARLMSESLEILRFLADHPENYDYFYRGKAAPEVPSETLKCIAEMFANYMEHVAQQRDKMPAPEREYWSKFVEESYARSPVVRKHLREFKDWYDPRLHRLVEGVAPLTPTEI
jgi:hypothetical protein